jgi:hypothetical protein
MTSNRIEHEDALSSSASVGSQVAWETVGDFDEESRYAADGALE